MCVCAFVCMCVCVCVCVSVCIRECHCDRIVSNRSYLAKNQKGKNVVYIFVHVPSIDATIKNVTVWP